MLLILKFVKENQNLYVVLDFTDNFKYFFGKSTCLGVTGATTVNFENFKVGAFFVDDFPFFPFLNKFFSSLSAFKLLNAWIYQEMSKTKNKKFKLAATLEKRRPFFCVNLQHAFLNSMKKY